MIGGGVEFLFVVSKASRCRVNMGFGRFRGFKMIFLPGRGFLLSWNGQLNVGL